MSRAAALAGLALALAGCGGGGGARVGTPIPQDRIAADWRRVAIPADRERLRNWRPTWLAALAAARQADAGAIGREGALFDPDRALPDPVPPPGAYKCRVFKLGAQGSAAARFVAYPYFECRVEQEGEVASLAKTTGSQRPVGLLFDGGQNRAVFLGTLQLGDESGTLEYGRDANRDLAGLLERVGPGRWRLALPAPRFESKLDVIELVPAG